MTWVLGELSNSRISQVETEELITSDVNCNSLLHKAKNYHLLPGKQGTELGFRSGNHGCLRTTLSN